MTVRAIMAKRAIANRTVHTQNLKHKRNVNQWKAREFQNYHNVVVRLNIICWQKGFQRVLKGFQTLETGSPKGFRMTSNPLKTLLWIRCVSYGGSHIFSQQQPTSSKSSSNVCNIYLDRPVFKLSIENETQLDHKLMDGSFKTENIWIGEVSSFEWYMELPILSFYPPKIASKNSEGQLLNESRNLLLA